MPSIRLAMTGTENKILATLLDRLYATLTHGPCLNCRVHNSRQRVDLFSITALQHLSVKEVVPKLILDQSRLELRGNVPVYRGPVEDNLMSEKDRAAKLSYEAQSRLLARLRDIAGDALDYERETGENALYIGYPFISIPPGNDLIGAGAPNPRVLAPLALIAVDMAVKRGAVQSVSLTPRGDGVDLVIPNYPLLAWLESQTGQAIPELFADEDGQEPYREIGEIIQLVARLLQIESPAELAPGTPFEAIPKTSELPGQPAFLNAAALGLFPVSNQGLLRDLKAMVGGESLSGPVELFLNPRVDGAPTESEFLPGSAAGQTRDFTKERLVTRADPFQSRAVRESEEHPCLVIHGPPGTGKSQTITNIIGDHLARGERVLMVCDKRTAIDVVHNRLEHLGIGDLCAIVHDPQRDQRSLYLKLRAQLEALPEKRINSRSIRQLEKIDDELRSVHVELADCFRALTLADAKGSPAFHDLVGEWFSISGEGALDAALHSGLTIAQLDKARADLTEALDRAARVGFPHNPWSKAAGIKLPALLGTPLPELHRQVEELRDLADRFDESGPEILPPLEPQTRLETQATDREALGRDLMALHDRQQNPDAIRWLREGIRAVGEALALLHTIRPAVDAIDHRGLDAELSVNLSSGLPPLTEINTAIVALAGYETIADKWYGFVCLGRKSAAAKILAAYGLAPDKAAALRLREFLEGIKARLLVKDYCVRRLGSDLDAAALPADERLSAIVHRQESVLNAAHALQSNSQFSGLEEAVISALEEDPSGFARRLDASAARARSLHNFNESLRQSGLFNAAWLKEFDLSLRDNASAGPTLAALADHVGSLEDIVRSLTAHRGLPEILQPAAAELIRLGRDGESGFQILHRALLGTEITLRIRTDPTLQQIDRDRVESLLNRYGSLLEKKEKNVRDLIDHLWSARQRDRLVDTGRKQLNTAGASLKRRLLLRGKNAMKLRQMIQHGRDQEGGDPLFDICPVWMASPATVALIFPREPIFDVIVFDEASQCRLEEAIPVLTRGRRVVIAGDPKQLPPTRFFESAFADSELQETETDQDLFEQQQSDTEDLLAAALNLQIHQAYLDVHYRSHHESLIGFSNEHFYHKRLQPIPAHPSTRAVAPAIELHHVAGVYHQRGNRAEVDAVVRLVRELLAESKPPSIGIACFNLVQRDLMLAALEAAADEDKEFGARYDLARDRVGEGSFEGIFVKNLENVQGDERDCMIISTTFGPDKQGRFRRNFGPVGRQGGGRRLNVLVTRARRKIHVVTSIPRTEYRVLPELEDKQSPSGRWLLYAYLHYAENLGEQRRLELLRGASTEASESVAHQIPTRQPSLLATWLGQKLAATEKVSSDIHWGNDGFRVDVALHHPTRSDQRSLGVLCDLHRFADAPDPVDWELFRTRLLEAKGWNFLRVLSPALFRDPAKHQREIAEQAAKLVAKMKLPPLPEAIIDEPCPGPPVQTPAPIFPPELPA
jgi:hypothetical protein